jgi:hypothetical protein
MMKGGGVMLGLLMLLGARAVAAPFADPTHSSQM